MQLETATPTTAVAPYFGGQLGRIAEVRAANKGPNSMFGIKDLIKIKMPGAGGVSWTIEGGDTPITAEDFRGVILAWQPHRGFFKTGYEGGNAPPDCYAEEPAPGMSQLGSVIKPLPYKKGGKPYTYGGACATCPVGQWRGEGKQKERPFCRERMRVYVQTALFGVPVWIDFPSTSVPAFNRYMDALTKWNFPHYSVVTIFSLEKFTPTKPDGTNGIAYSRIVLKALRMSETDRRLYVFGDDEQVQIMPFRESILTLTDPAKRAARIVDAEEDRPARAAAPTAAEAYGLTDDDEAELINEADNAAMLNNDDEVGDFDDLDD